MAPKLRDSHNRAVFIGDDDTSVGNRTLWGKKSQYWVTTVWPYSRSPIDS